MNQNENFYLTKAPIGKLLFKFACPCVLAMLVSALYNIVDQIFIGQDVGYIGNAATTVVYPFTVLALAFALLIGDGSAALFSISLGSKEDKVAKKSIGNSIILVLIASVVLMVLGFALMPQILNFFGATTTSFGYAKDYMTVILCGIPFFMLTSCLSSFIRADGSPLFSMIATLLGAVINIVLDPIAIFVLKWGVLGAGVATIIGQIASAILCLIYLKRTKLIKLDRESFKLDKKISFKMCKLGLSSFITQISIAVITVVVNKVIIAINDPVYGADIPISALGIVFKVFGIVISFCVGIAVGGQPIIGYNYGAKNYKRVLETYKYILLANLIVGIVAMLLFEFMPMQLVQIFGAQNDIYNKFAVMSFRIYLGGIILCCLQKASCIFLQSIDKPYKSMILSLMRDVIFLVPGVCLLAFLGNLELMLWAGPIADGLAFAFTVLFIILEYRKLKKLIIQNQEILEEAPIKNTFVLTIDREFGSGGKYIGEQVAKHFGINCYDNQLLTKVAEKYNVDMKVLESVDEKQMSSFWYGFATNVVFKDGQIQAVSAEDNLFLKQARTIEELYENESCVIIGRCSDFVLKNKPNVVSVFVYSTNLEFKVERKMNFENTSREETLNNIKVIDTLRSNYYNRFTDQTWGDKKNYNLCLDSSSLGVDECVQYIIKYIEENIKISK